MKKLLTFILGITLSVWSVTAQTADEIIDKNIKALGGLDKIKSIESVIMEGKVNANGMEIPMKFMTLKNKAFKMVIEVMGMKGWMSVNKDSGWVFMPFGGGQTKPEAMTADQVKESVDQMDLEGELVNYKEKGHTVEYLGMDDVEGTECHKLKVVTKAANTHYYLIDPTSFHIVRKVSKQKADGKEYDVQVDFSNYKETESGFIFPYTIASQNGPVEMTKILVNSTIDPSMFEAEK
ncbi:MAG: hypothetical protein HOP11_14710 [Saprospiraceae bacterium]|nr:hypothetical protein [Saprospiraceae bacterium]